jgi:hypothetical protein
LAGSRFFLYLGLFFFLIQFCFNIFARFLYEKKCSPPPPPNNCFSDKFYEEFDVLSGGLEASPGA